MCSVEWSTKDQYTSACDLISMADAEQALEEFPEKPFDVTSPIIAGGFLQTNNYSDCEFRGIGHPEAASERTISLTVYLDLGSGDWAGLFRDMMQDEFKMLRDVRGIGRTAFWGFRSLGSGHHYGVLQVFYERMQIRVIVDDDANANSALESAKIIATAALKKLRT